MLRAKHLPDLPESAVLRARSLRSQDRVLAWLFVTFVPLLISSLTKSDPVVHWIAIGAAIVRGRRPRSSRSCREGPPNHTPLHLRRQRRLPARRRTPAGPHHPGRRHDHRRRRRDAIEVDLASPPRECPFARDPALRCDRIHAGATVGRWAARRARLASGRQHPCSADHQASCDSMSNAE